MDKLNRAGPVAVMALVTLTMLASVHSATAQTCARDPVAAFDAALSVTLAAVHGDDADTLLSQMSPDGVAFGTDGPLVAFVVLKTQFTAKTGRYCDLFACNGVEGPLHHLFVAGPMEKTVDVKHGLAAVYISGNTPDELDLSYRFGPSCRWELTGIGAP